MINGFKDAVKSIKYAMQYGIHSNDLSLREIEEKVTSAIDKLAKLNGEPQIDWESEDEDDNENSD